MKFEVPEPDEWEAYVKRGDFHPEPAIWNKTFSVKGRNSKARNELQLISKRLTAKDKAHMNFIESGKKRR